MTQDRIAVVYIDADERLAHATARYLEEHAVGVTVATNATSGFAAIVRHQPDVILVDDVELCPEIRARVDTPIIVVTTNSEEADRVMALEAGVDDYLAKPFSSRELLARIRAHARRWRGAVGPRKEIAIGRIAVDRLAMRVTLDGNALALTTYEFLLIVALAERAGRVLTREQAVDLVRGSADEAFERSVDIHISHLRAKLGDDPRNPRLIKTVRGVGYMLAIEERRTA